jgi:hypothetical protein
VESLKVEFPGFDVFASPPPLVSSLMALHPA